MNHRILLVDDEIDILEFIKYNLEKEGYLVATAENGAEALRTAESFLPHLILLDRMMPVMDGVETCRAIRKNPRLKDTLVVFLTALSDDSEELKGFDAGADDYIAKPIKLPLLKSRLQAILKRLPLNEATPDHLTESELTIDRDRYSVTLAGREIILPRKEFALLYLLYSSAGKLITRKDIYTKIWGDNVVVGDRTIDVHIRKLRQKIGFSHITTIKGVGYKFEP